jgi:hypothetical protein
MRKVFPRFVETIIIGCMSLPYVPVVKIVRPCRRQGAKNLITDVLYTIFGGHKKKRGRAEEIAWIAFDAIAEQIKDQILEGNINKTLRRLTDRRRGPGESKVCARDCEAFRYAESWKNRLRGGWRRR